MYAYYLEVVYDINSMHTTLARVASNNNNTLVVLCTPTSNK